MTRVVIAGVSTRAAAASASRAGFDVTAIDAYADRDQHPRVRAIAIPRHLGGEFTAANAAAAAAGLDADAVAYLSNFENNPGAVAALAARRTLWGNAPDVLRRVRDPFTVAATFRTHGIHTPRLQHDPNDPNDWDDSNGWLLKPLSSGGGHGIREWRPGEPIPPGHYVQQRIHGTPASVVFVAAGGRAAVLGVSRQLIGDVRFGCHGFRYCGNILAPQADPQFDDGEELWGSARRAAEVAAAYFGLVGANGIDFVAVNGAACPIEINPRWSASMELVERLSGMNVFAAHAAACSDAVLFETPSPPSRAVGKAVVFARQDVTIHETDAWLDDPAVGDVPHAGEAFPSGSPICTVFAEAATALACEAELVQRATQIYSDLDRSRPIPARPIHHSQFTIHD